MFSRATSAVHLGWLPCGRVKANDLHRQTSLTGTASGTGRLRPVPEPDAHAWNAADIDTPAPTEPVPSALRFHPTQQVQRVDELAARLALALRDNAAANRTMYTLSSLGDDGRIWIVVSFVEAATDPCGAFFTIHVMKEARSIASAYGVGSPVRPSSMRQCCMSPPTHALGPDVTCVESESGSASAR